MSRSTLIRWAGVSAAIAGFLFIIVQFIHPPETVASVGSNTWMLVSLVTLSMAIFGSLGITGIYATQVEQAGKLGLIGFLMLYLWFMLIVAFTFAEALILPLLVNDLPQFVSGFLALSSGAPYEISFGALEAVGPISGALYILGGLIFGIATIRAALLPRWAAALLILGTLSAVLVPLLPKDWGRMTVIPVGIGLIWLGYALWTEKPKRETAVNHDVVFESTR